MEKQIGRIWISLTVLAVAIVILIFGDTLKVLQPKPDGSAFLIALSQLGILYIVALFVERALEVLIKAWRQGGKVCLEQEEGDNGQKEKKLKKYKAGTQRRALLTGLTLGLLVSLSGVRLLGPIFPFSDIGAFQTAVFHFTDIIITAGLIAGGSSTIHELMALIDDFLRASRNRGSS